jgi:hypothetical protein
VWELLRQNWHELMYDPARARIWLRGFVLWLGAVGAEMFGAGIDHVTNWTLREWLVRFVIAGFIGTTGLISSHGPRQDSPAAPQNLSKAKNREREERAEKLQRY